MEWHLFRLARGKTVPQERRLEGDETWITLREWLAGQKASERLAGQVLLSEGYSEVDPSHPLGGKDGGKDILCRKDGKTFVGAVYFSRGQQSFSKIRKKFTQDLRGVAKNNADGLVFVTNQELKIAERKELQEFSPTIEVELYHLERLTNVLNATKNYGIRLEYLGIRITEDEHLAFLAARDEEHYRRLHEINARLDSVLAQIEKQTTDLIGYATGGDSVAYLTPSVRMGTHRIELRLFNFGEYPVFDIHGRYVDIDEPKKEHIATAMMTITLGETVAIGDTFSWAALYPGNTPAKPVFVFDMTHKERIAINVFLHTRMRDVRQYFRFFKVNGEIVLAYKTEAEGRVIERTVPPTVPNNNPDDPDAVFK
jgi:hypothetical protein